MSSPPRSNRKYLWLLLFLLSISPFVARLLDERPKDTCGQEKFDPNLGHLKSIDEVLAYADKNFSSNRLQTTEDTAAYVSQMSELFKQRFCHGELNFRYSENWLAWLAGELFWSHFSSMVLTKDVMKHSKCLCNQQTLAFMEALFKKGITTRTVGLGDKVPGHFVCEVHYGGSWHYYDISIEPNWEKVEQSHRELEFYLNNRDMFYKIYEGRMTRPLFDAILVKHSYGEPNDFPGKKMKFFQAGCEVISYLLPILSLGMFLWGFRKKHKVEKIPSPGKRPLSDTVQK